MLTALWLPLARNAWLINSAESPPGELFGGFLPYLLRQLQTFTLWGTDWSAPTLWAGLALFALLILLGWLLPRRGEDQPVRLLLLLWSVPPLLIAGVMQATNSNVLKEDRYFLFIAPFVLWAVARAAVALGERVHAVGWLAGGAAVILLVAALPSLWTPALYRENWRGTAAYMADYQDQSGALPAAGVIHADYLYGALYWYLQPRYPFETLPVYQIFNGQVTDAEMAIIGPRSEGIEKTGAETLWLVQSHLAGVDDAGLVKRWLDERYPVITEQFPVGIHLSGYALRSIYDALPPLAETTVYPQTELAPGLTLAACEIITPEVAARNDDMHPPSGWVHVRLWWQATGEIAQNYRSTARVVGPEGVWGEALQRSDGPLQRLPTSQWEEGQFVRDEIDINLNPATPGNRRYSVSVGLQDADGVPLPETASCGEVWVQ